MPGARLRAVLQHLHRHGGGGQRHAAAQDDGAGARHAAVQQRRCDGDRRRRRQHLRQSSAALITHPCTVSSRSIAQHMLTPYDGDCSVEVCYPAPSTDIGLLQMQSEGCVTMKQQV